ncbi:MAG TPA: cache domain-containing protein [Ktedonobacterales bacterium]|nr:cache domain-containing protein [Ktedonobacterales bacterium]
MMPKRLRFGIRAQLTFIVLIAALLSTIATLYIANSAIQSYVIDQAEQREAHNLQVAWLVLHTEFGDNVSIDVKGELVADSPLSSNGAGLTPGSGGINQFLPYPLDNDVDYVDEVHHLVGGVVAVYKCSNAQGALTPGGCPRISTDITQTVNGQTQRNLNDRLNQAALQYTQQHPTTPLVEQDTVSGVQYIGAYQAMLSPQGDFIGVLFVGEPLAGVQALIFQTTIQLAIVGGLIMVVGAIFAILLAQAISGTLQTAARQVSAASTQFGSIAAQQSAGSAQQVWAINAISQALRNLSETATDVAKRSDQLAQMGVQVLQRRMEISPTQIDSIINYVTRSTHDISVQSRQQASTVDRMNGAMQAVMEVAQQVARDSQQTTEGAERLEQVVRQLQRLVGTSDLAGSKQGTETPVAAVKNAAPARGTTGSPGTASMLVPTAPSPGLRSIRAAQQDQMPVPVPTWPPAAPSTSGSLMRPSQSQGFTPSGARGRANSGELPTRPGQPRSSMPFTTSGNPGAFPSGNPGAYPSGNPGAFPSFDSGNLFPDDGNPSPTYQPPRRDQRGRR